MNDPRDLRLARTELDAAKVSLGGSPPVVMVAVVGCVDYRSDLDNLHHQTRFAFSLVGEEGTVSSAAMPPVGVQKSLRLTQMPGGNSAD
jgi:hypothetical protein